MKFAALASGSGSTVEHLIKAIKDGTLPHELALVVTDRANAGVLAVCEKHGIPTAIVNPAFHKDPSSWDETLLSILSKYDVEFVLLAGFLRRIGKQVLTQFSGRIINTHPSLLPKYGGKGMYGRNVHSAVLAAGEKETGVSIHLVIDEYDAGQVLAQKTVIIESGDTAESLESRVKAIEKEFLTDFLKTWQGSVAASKQ